MHIENQLKNQEKESMEIKNAAPTLPVHSRSLELTSAVKKKTSARHCSEGSSNDQMGNFEQLSAKLF